MEIAGLNAVIPLTPICSSVTRVTSSVSRSSRYTLLTPESSETKYTHSPCAHHCGLTLLPVPELPSGVTLPDGHAIAPSVYLPNSSCSADDVNRSDDQAAVKIWSTAGTAMRRRTRPDGISNSVSN